MGQESPEEPDPPPDPESPEEPEPLLPPDDPEVPEPEAEDSGPPEVDVAAVSVPTTVSAASSEPCSPREGVDVLEPDPPLPSPEPLPERGRPSREPLEPLSEPLVAEPLLSEPPESSPASLPRPPCRERSPLPEPEPPWPEESDPLRSEDAESS
jgi:hypothetical protein